VVTTVAVTVTVLVPSSGTEVRERVHLVFSAGELQASETV
jgi:hypothetical protein